MVAGVCNKSGTEINLHYVLREDLPSSPTHSSFPLTLFKISLFLDMFVIVMTSLPSPFSMLALRRRQCDCVRSLCDSDRVTTKKKRS